jgi:hypothetical protein
LSSLNKIGESHKLIFERFIKLKIFLRNDILAIAEPDGLPAVKFNCHQEAIARWETRRMRVEAALIPLPAVNVTHLRLHVGRF